MGDHILVVDDEQQTIDLLRLMLKTFNHKVEGATTGSEAIVYAEVDPPSLILLDLMLPDMTGVEVCTALRASAITANIPIIILTARYDEASHDRALEAGANFCLTKPVTRAVLRECLDKALEEGALASKFRH